MRKKLMILALLIILSLVGCSMQENKSNLGEMNSENRIESTSQATQKSIISIEPTINPEQTLKIEPSVTSIHTASGFNKSNEQINPTGSIANKVTPEEAIESIVSSLELEEKDLGYSGTEVDTGYYIIGWTNPSGGMGAIFYLDPIKGEVFDWQKKLMFNVSIEPNNEIDKISDDKLRKSELIDELRQNISYKLNEEKNALILKYKGLQSELNLPDKFKDHFMMYTNEDFIRIVNKEDSETAYNFKIKAKIGEYNTLEEINNKYIDIGLIIIDKNSLEIIEISEKYVDEKYSNYDLLDNEDIKINGFYLLDLVDINKIDKSDIISYDKDYLNGTFLVDGVEINTAPFNGHIYSISFKEPGIKTSKGIMIGDIKEKALECYGIPDEGFYSDDVWHFFFYRNKELKIFSHDYVRFVFQNNKVIEISFNAYIPAD